MIARLTTQFEEYDRKIFWVLLTCITIALFAYIFFLSLSVYAVIDRRTAEKNADALSAHISLLESQFVTLDRTVNLDRAHTAGFVDIGIPHYISRNATPPTLTLRGEVTN
jgi:hypothetical protein